MATDLVVNGAQVRKRNPWGAWGLIFLTLGIYQYVWFYKVNRELRDAHRIEVDPALTVLALTLGTLILVPPFVAIYRTGKRIKQAQGQVGIQNPVSPPLAFLLAFILSLNIPYLQAELNKMWDASSETPRVP